MEIIKQGDPNKVKGTIKFECKQCGCVFKAERSEWFYETLGGKVGYTSFCPYCGRKVWDKE